jgi:hypothetical protein
MSAVASLFILPSAKNSQTWLRVSEIKAMPCNPETTQFYMTQFPYDQFSKDCLDILLSHIATVMTSRKVAAEIREVDVYSELKVGAVPPADLGLLQRCTSKITVFEPFRNAASPGEIRACISKLIELHNEHIREAKRLKQPMPRAEDLARLWIVTPTLSKAVLTSFGAVSNTVLCSAGVYQASSALHTGFIVVHQLPKTPDTLWFRLLGRGRVRSQAASELFQLPAGHPYQVPLLDALEALQVILETKNDLETDEQELFMQLTSLYRDKLAAAKAEGIREGRQEGLQEGRQEGLQEGRQEVMQTMVLKLLTKRLGILSSACHEQIMGLTINQLDTLSEAILDFQTLEDLEQWLNSEFIH